MAAHAGKGRHPARGIRWLWAMGLGVPIILGLALIVIVVVSLVSPRYKPPEMISVGDITRFDLGSPVYFEEQRFWLVRLPSESVIALYSIDPESSCPVTWRPDLEFMGARGWFRDPCHGSTYDLEGKCLSGPCIRGMDRVGVLMQRSEVLVKVREVSNGPPVDFYATPLTPPEG